MNEQLQQPAPSSNPQPQQADQNGAWYQPQNDRPAYNGRDLAYNQPTATPPLPPQTVQLQAPLDSSGGVTPTPTAGAALQSPQQQDTPLIEWEASEYVHHDKGVGWIVIVAAIALVIVGISLYFGIYTLAVLTVVMAVAFVIVAFRPPKSIHYLLSSQGLQLDDRFYHYSEFKAFGVLQEGGAIYSLVLLPAKRLLPAINIYFEEKDGEKIVDALGHILPMKPMQLSLFDRIVRKLRF